MPAGTVPVASDAQPQPSSPQALTTATLAAAAGGVVGLAIAVRIPACWESFWTDELHSAWAVWGSFPEVAPRAAAGNQTPFYFWGLWLWKLLFGGSEIALRLSSVLAMAAASGILVVTVARQHASLLAGLLAGLFLAVDANALFFGTELRPYAWVVLGTTVACGLVATLLRHHRLPSERIGRWGQLAAIVCLTGLLQPTALAALLPLLVIGGWHLLMAPMMRWRAPSGDGRGVDLRDRGQATILLLAMLVIGLTGWVLLRSAVAEAWSSRDHWESFASSHRWSQLWTIWPWGSFVLVPATLAWGLTGLAAWRGHQPSPARPAACSPARPAAWPWLLILAVGVTSLTWWAARDGWIPLWHRRYMIAVLPMLVWVAGSLWAKAAEALAELAGKGSQLRRNGIRGFVLLSALLLLVWQQGTLQRWQTGDGAVVHRGEGWREAAAWIAQHRRPEEPLWVAAELIESRALLDRAEELPPSRAAYLTYVVRGPYALAAPQPLGPLRRTLVGVLQGQPAVRPARPPATDTAGDATAETRAPFWLLARYSGARLKALLAAADALDPPIDAPMRPAHVATFGGVSVVKFEAAPAPPEGR